MSSFDVWWNRFGSLSGVLFVVLTIVGGLLTSPFYRNPSLGPESSSSEIASALTSFGYLGNVGVLLEFAGVFFFFWFLSYLRDGVQATEGGRGQLGSVIFGAGLVLAALSLVLLSFRIAELSVTNYGSDTVVAKTFFIYGWNFAEVLAPPAIAMIAATTVAGLRSKAFPRWFTWFGLALTVISFVLFPLLPGTSTLLFVLWVLVVSLMLYAQGRRKTP